MQPNIKSKCVQTDVPLKQLIALLKCTDLLKTATHMSFPLLFHLVAAEYASIITAMHANNNMNHIRQSLLTLTSDAFKNTIVYLSNNIVFDIVYHFFQHSKTDPESIAHEYFIDLGIDNKILDVRHGNDDIMINMKQYMQRN